MVEQATCRESGSAPAPGTCVRLIVVFTMAGAVLGGGGVIAAIGFVRPGVSYLLLGLVPPLFLVGALVGFSHGAVLAWLGRPERLERGLFAKALKVGGLCSIPGLAVAAVIAFWIAYTTALISAGRTFWTIAVVSGWIGASVLCLWAVVAGAKAARIAFGRWPERRPGLVLVAGTFLGLVLLLSRWEFAAWGPGLRFRTAGVLLAAFALTLWVAAPIEVLLLRAVRRRRTEDSRNRVKSLSHRIVHP